MTVQWQTSSKQTNSTLTGLTNDASCFNSCGHKGDQDHEPPNSSLCIVPQCRVKIVTLTYFLACAWPSSRKRVVLCTGIGCKIDRFFLRLSGGVKIRNLLFWALGCLLRAGSLYRHTLLQWSAATRPKEQVHRRTCRCGGGGQPTTMTTRGRQWLSFRLLCELKYGGLKQRPNAPRSYGLWHPQWLCLRQPMSIWRFMQVRFFRLILLKKQYGCQDKVSRGRELK